MSVTAAEMKEAEYHAHPALSYSTGKHLLRSRRHYLEALAHRDERAEYDIGHAVHSLVLGIGAEIVEVPYDSYRTKAAQELRDAIRAEGKVPLKTAEIEPIHACVKAVLSHPTARSWLEREGQAEVPLFATDPGTGVDIRGKVDWLTEHGKWTVPVDLKTTTDARPDAVFRSVREHDYDLQAAMYRHLIRLALDREPGPMVLIAVEKASPYGVMVHQLAHEDLIAAGEMKLQKILARAKALRDEPDGWDGYPLGTHVLTPHGYYLTDLESRLDDDE